MSYLKNTTGQYLYFVMVNASDGSAITSGTVAGYRSIDGGAQASVTGAISHKGNGQWELAMSQADTNGDEIGFLFTHTSGIPVSISIVTDAKKNSDLNDLSAAQVNAEVDTALADIHLDHLLAADYDPASKPGVATALLNEMVEDDGGVSRFTANALEEAPSGSGVSDWTTTEKEHIRYRLQLDGTQTAPTTDAPTQLPADAGAISGDETAADNLEAMLDGTGGVTLDLAKLHIDADDAEAGLLVENASGDAIVGKTNVGHGMYLKGGGSAAKAGLYVWGGNEGMGIFATGGIFGGPGIRATAENDGIAGLECRGFGDGPGIYTRGGVDGHGIEALGGTTSGDGIHAEALANGDGIEAIGDGAGYDIHANIQGSVSGTPIPASYADAVWDAAKADHVAAGSFGEEVQAHALSSELFNPGSDTVTVGENTDKTGYSLDSGEYTSIADALLKRDWTAVSGEAARSVLNALRFLRNRWTVISGTLTVYEEDDATEAWSATTTEETSADVVTGSDPN